MSSDFTKKLSKSIKTMKEGVEYNYFVWISFVFFVIMSIVIHKVLLQNK